MSILDEEEEYASTMEINFKEIEKKLQFKRKMTIAIITLIFTISIGLITYSVMSDLKTQRGKERRRSYQVIKQDHLMSMACMT